MNTLPFIPKGSLTVGIQIASVLVAFGINRSTSHYTPVDKRCAESGAHGL
ncbi:MAG: hypothetical protein IPO98_07430 [Saprospiraceae bacterium]|nr:hypothetical protein [Saprospiraceae bacterium]